jgi:hypothetical protein
MKINKIKIICLSIILLSAFGVVSAQENSVSAEDEFEVYERNISQTPPQKPRKNASNKSTNTKPVKPTVSPVVRQNNDSKIKTQVSGLPGMKIWLERQIGCDGQFSLVAPTSVFKSGDCLRAKFRINFDGYLTIINLGTSGKNTVIFPLDDENNRIYPKTENYLPDNQGWEFDDQTGNEQLIFIISRVNIPAKFIKDFVNNRELIVADSPDIEVYDRDLKPRTEKSSVYFLAPEARLEKPLVFRMTLKHR